MKRETRCCYSSLKSWKVRWRDREEVKKVKQENVMSPIKSIYLTITFVCKKAVKREEKALIIHCNGRRDCWFIRWILCCGYFGRILDFLIFEFFWTFLNFFLIFWNFLVFLNIFLKKIWIILNFKIILNLITINF